MRAMPVIAAFLMSFSALAGASAVRADELVQVAPHRASASATNPDGTPPLFGFLTHPNAPGRFPAVILLHGCPGFTEHDTAAAAMLKSWGYVALALDSLGNANMCGEPAVGGAAEMLDADAALRYLASLRFVDSARVAIMGWSMGGTAALAAMEKHTGQFTGQASVRAVIAYYPDCGAGSGVLTIPALILVGERDDWAPAAACRKLAAHESDLGTRRDSSAGTPIDLVVYPEATHAFDYRLPPMHYLGHFTQYDADATRDAEAHVRDFLHRALGEPTEGAR